MDLSHPALQQLEREVAEAEARQKEASVFYNPGLTLEREAWGEDAQQTTLALEWTPPFLGGRGAKRAAARHGLESARHYRDAELLRIRQQARAAYAAWWVAVERWSLLSGQARQVRRITERVRNRAESGEESGLTARRFELALLRVEAELLKSDIDRKRAEAVIRAWTRRTDQDLRPAAPVLPPPPGSLTWDSHPRVLTLRESVERARLERKGAGGVLAFPSLQFGWIWQEEAGVDGALAGVSWDLPIFNRNQAEKARARGDLLAARAELDLEEATAEAELAAAIHAYRAVREPAIDARIATEDMTPLVEAALASFQAGERTDTDLLEILESTLEARLGALDLYLTAHDAHRALEEAAGRPLTQGASR